MSLISVIMPVYEAEKSLAKSIDSVRAQSEGHWELIAVDDGSRDSSLSILQAYAAQDSRIRVVHQENAGPGEARNAAIAMARGDYLAFLDADDTWESDFLWQVEQKIGQHDADVIFYDLVHEREDGTLIRYGKLSDFAPLSCDGLIRCQMTGKMEWGMVKVIRRSLVAEYGLRFSSDHVGEEAIFSFDVLRRAKRVAFVDKPLYHYVQSAGGQHKKGKEDPWGAIVAKMKQHLMEQGCYATYEKTVNSFALRALCIACYRLALSQGGQERRRAMRQKIDEYASRYDLHRVEKASLDTTAKLMLPLIRMRWITPICLAAKLREGNRKS